MKLKVEYVPIDSIRPYAGNAKDHPKSQIEQIKQSMKEFGNIDPIGVWRGEVVEGHGRLEAAKQLGYTEIPIIRLDELTDEQRRAYGLIHNQLTMNSGFDADALAAELASITDIDMAEYGFDADKDLEEDDTYTQKIDIPHYEIKGEKVNVGELVDTTKSDQLIEAIHNSKLDEDVKRFLMLAAARHNVFDYAKIAEFYAQADAEIQKLMEDSALVIIDYEDAIRNGYVTLSKEIDDLLAEAGVK